MARVPDLICAGGCGKLMWSGKTSLPQGQAMCQLCRRAIIAHGTRKAYRGGCRCEPCKIWNREQHRAYIAARVAGLHPFTSCVVDGCTNQSYSRKMCRMHYKRWARAAGMVNSPSEKWNDTRRSNYHARRARLNGARNGDKVLFAKLVEGDGYTCSACKEHVDVSVPWPEAHSPSIDHTIPLSKGGAHSMANTTVMHLVCNMRKGAQMPADKGEANKQEGQRERAGQA
jgi:5-methylcytosine-specific restriction endonuclease McrA